MLHWLRAFRQPTTYLGLAMIAVLWGGIYVLASEETARAYQDGMRQGSNLAHVLEEYIARVVRASDSALLALRESYERGPKQFDLTASAESIRAHNELNVQFAIADADGRMRYLSREEVASPIIMGDRSYFQFQAHSNRDELYIGEPIVGRRNGKPLVPLSRRLSKPDGSFDGVIVAVLDADQLERFFSSLDLGRDGIVSVAGLDGIIRARSGANAVAQQSTGMSIAGTQAFRLFQQSTSGSYWNPNRDGHFEGVGRLICYRMVDGLPLVAIVGLAGSDLYLQANKTIGNYIVVGIVLTSLLLIAVTIGAVYQARLFSTTAELQTSKLSLEQMNVWFDAALENMPHGLCLFDRHQRLRVCNAHYGEMYKLKPQQITPGTSLSEILAARVAAGTSPADAEHYVQSRLEEVSRHEPFYVENQLRDGRVFAIAYQPMADGGWVGIHQDVSAQKQVERALRDSTEAANQSNARLAAAFQNISQGVAMFDRSACLVLCNDRYLEMYGLSREAVTPGCRLEDILALRVAAGTIFGQDPVAYQRDLLAEVLHGRTVTKTVQLSDGRIIDTINRPIGRGGWVASHDDVTEHRRREASLRLLFENNPVPMWVFDRESLRFLAVNNAAVSHYGYSQQQFLAMSVPDIRLPEDRARFVQFFRTQPETQHDVDVGKHRKADGSTMDVCVYSQGLRYQGCNAQLVAIYDVTERKRTEEELRRTQKFLDTVFENVPVPILVKDVPRDEGGARKWRYSLINRACEDFFGVSRERMIGKTVEELYRKEEAEFIIAEIEEILQSDRPVEMCDHTLHRLDESSPRRVTSKSVAIRDDSGEPRHLLTVLEDVTERRQSERRIWQMAHTDNLTSLPNRAAFGEYFATSLEQAARSGQPFAVLSMDLDGFKETNDSFGHAIGDALLCEAARRLQGAAAGQFLARIGGDEFCAIVTGGPQPATATALAEQLLAAFAGDFDIEGQRLRIGLTIGGAVYPVDGPDAKTLMVNADAALYRAKAETRGSVLFYESEMGARLRERHALQEDLRKAIENDELLLHYQPQVRMNGETVGFEALVRWQSAKRGLVSPGSFVPIAEESNLIIALGEWVLREACGEAASWAEPLSVAVNISPVQFRRSDLPTLVHSVLLETGLAPGRLELEITEGVFIDDFSHAISVLRRLKSLGVQIALDDFGTGYSSLSYLHSFSFDKIKIDRAFVTDLEHNRHSIAIIRAVINLGHNLNIPTLAEGVETNAQHAFLANEGCDQVQGYLTGRPSPIAEHADRVHRIGSREPATSGRKVHASS